MDILTIRCNRSLFWVAGVGLFLRCCLANTLIVSIRKVDIARNWYYQSRGSGATWCPGIFNKKKSADRPVTAPFALHADIHRPQTTPFFGLVQYPPPESSYLQLYRGSNATAHIPRKLSSFCALFGAPSLAKSPAKLSWMMIWTLLPISSPARHLCRHLSCAPLAMRSCAALSHVLMATAMSEHISSAGLSATVRVRWLGRSYQPK